MKSELSALVWNSQIGSWLNYGTVYLGVDLSSTSGCRPTADSWRVSVAHAEHPCCAPCPLPVPGSFWTRGLHTVPGPVLGNVASMISLNGESTYSHCHLAHIFQLTFFDYQGICIIHALPAPSLL